MGIIGINDIRTGNALKIDDELYWVVDADHVKPGKGQAFCRVTLKNVDTGQVVKKTYKQSDKIEEVRLELRKCQYLYEDNDLYYFMDMETYEQLLLSENMVEDKKYYLKEEMDVELLMYGEKSLGLKLPTFVNLQITKTKPAVKGDTVSNATKKATLETGLEVKVPLFVKRNEVIKVDTRNGEYVERVN